MSFRGLFGFFNKLHNLTSVVTVPIGALIAIDMNIDKFNKKGNMSLFESFLLIAPEAFVGCVSGYFWVYTLPPISAYKRYMFHNLYK